MMLSIIIPVYNAENYIKKTIGDVLIQNYTNYELIIIDDGSTDDSLAICEETAKTDHRIIVVNQQNRGPAAARNVGIKLAKGDYIGFVDADDEILPDYFKTLLNAALAYQVDVVISNIKVVNRNNVSVLTNNLSKNEVLNSEKIRENILSSYFNSTLGNIPSLVNKLYRSSFLKQNNLLIDETRIRAEDYWFNFYVFKKAHNCIAIDYAGYTYKVSIPESVMKTFRKNQFEGFLKTRVELLRNNEDLNININYGIWDTEFITNTNEYILLAIKNNRKDIVKKILNNEEFQNAIRNYLPSKMHTKLLKKMINNKLDLFAYCIYYYWSKKI